MTSTRIDAILRRCIEDYRLDLTGLTVLTEAATGAYLHTPILAALAGAEKVLALATTSRFGSREEVAERTLEAARERGLEDRIDVLFDKRDPRVAAADIVTNSGGLRPLDRALLGMLKPTAVIPLMWETWEFRPEDLDLAYCREKGLLVLGTDESKLSRDFYSVSGFLALKLLFELGLEGYGTRVLLLGGGFGLGRSVHARLLANGMDVHWFADGESDARPNAEMGPFMQAKANEIDALLIAEHANPLLLIGEHGLIPWEEIATANPALAVGVIAGNIDREGLRRSGLRFFPADLRPWGYMSYQAYHLGPLPVLELYAAGLQVGMVTARARLEGMSVEQATKHALAYSPAMDFVEEKGEGKREK